MSLQSRLFTFFILILILPLGVAAFAGQRLVVGELERRTVDSLVPAQRAAAAVYESKHSGARDRVQLIVGRENFQTLLLDKKYDELEEVVREQLSMGTNPIDFLVVADPSGKVLAEVFSQADFLRNTSPPTAQEVLAGTKEEGGSRRLMVTLVVVPISSTEETIATVVGGHYLDDGFVTDLSEDTGVDVSLFLDGMAVSSTVPEIKRSSAPVGIDLSNQGDVYKVNFSGVDAIAIPAQLQGSVALSEAALVVSTPQQDLVVFGQGIQTFVLIALVIMAAVSLFLGSKLARAVARPVSEVAEAARAVSKGDYDHHIEVRGGGEIEVLASAFNEMTERLKAHVSELRASREDLKRAMTRFADTLKATHDQRKMLSLVLETSIDMLDAKAGVLMWMEGAGDSLTPSIGMGVELEDMDDRIYLGEGIAGHVGSTGEPVRVPEEDLLAEPSKFEAQFETVLVVPIFARERTVAVLNLYDRQDEKAFTEAHMDTLLSLADVAGVAIENVLLHQEVTRQAIEDSLTGLWNRRYFLIRFEQEVDRAKRFGHALSLLVIDCDDFKTINDTYGHQRGDEVLIELARRMKSQVREIDSLARTGGEEFVMILPETSSEGARQAAEKIRKAVSSEPFKGDPEVEITVSVGVASFPEDGSDQNTLWGNADRAMYKAKDKGKNQVVVFGKEQPLKTA